MAWKVSLESILAKRLDIRTDMRSGCYVARLLLTLPGLLVYGEYVVNAQAAESFLGRKLTLTQSSLLYQIPRKGKRCRKNSKQQRERPS